MRPSTYSRSPVPAQIQAALSLEKRLGLFKLVATATISLIRREIHDPLSYLPRAFVSTHTKGSQIYGQDMASRSLCLVLAGKVKVCSTFADGRESIIDFFRSDDLFGEKVFLQVSDPEMAVAIDTVSVMRWPLSQIEEIVVREPRLGLALMQVFVQRSADAIRRIQSFAIDSVSQRVGRAIMHFAERFGEPCGDGAVRVDFPFTHQLLAGYVGTSRELVTQTLNRLRQLEVIDYSRRGIVLRGKGMDLWLARMPKAE